MHYYKVSVKTKEEVLLDLYSYRVFLWAETSYPVEKIKRRN